MSKILTALVLSSALLTTAVPANAGCVTGALVGGIAGHFLGGHGLVGAAAGCAGGAYLNHRQNQQQLQNRPYSNGQDPRYTNRPYPDTYNR